MSLADGLLVFSVCLLLLLYFTNNVLTIDKGFKTTYYIRRAGVREVRRGKGEEEEKIRRIGLVKEEEGRKEEEGEEKEMIGIKIIKRNL